MPRARKKNLFGFLTEKRETYHRDVAGERSDRARAAKQEKQRAAEKSRRLLEELKDDGHTAGGNDKRAGKKLTPYRLDLLISPRYEEAFGKRRARELMTSAYKSGYRSNPAQSATQYRLAQAVLSGTARATGMSKKAAQEIVDRTPKKLRSLFMRQNPEDAAAELSEAFTGRPAETATQFRKTIHYHSVLTGLAPLMQIKIWVDERHVKAINFDRNKAFLGSAESGEQLYVEGEDLAIDLAAFGITGHAATKDLIRIGDVYSVTYWTAKFHLGKADKTPGPYEHIFSEHGEEEPELLYDRLNQEPQFAGGEYHIPIDIDGKYSSGINN